MISKEFSFAVYKFWKFKDFKRISHQLSHEMSHRVDYYETEDVEERLEREWFTIGRRSVTYNDGSNGAHSDEYE